MRSITELLSTIMRTPAVDIATKMRAGFLLSRLTGGRRSIYELFEL